MLLKDFYKLLNHPGELITIENVEILSEEPIYIDNSQFKSIGLLLKNCQFYGEVSFRNSFAPYGINIQNCEFKNILSFENVIIQDKGKTQKQVTDHIIINKTTVSGFINFTKCAIDGNILIYSSTVNKLYVDSLKSFNGHFTINDSTFNENFFLKKIELEKHFRLENALINSQVRIENVKAESYEFIDTTIKKLTMIWAGEARNGICFMNGIYEDDFKIEAVKTNPIEEDKHIPNLVFNGVEFKKSCVINYYDNINNSGGCPEIYIDSATFTNALIVDSNKSLELYPINKIQVDASKQLKGEIIFNRLEVEETILKGTNYEASIIFNKVDFRKLFLNYFSNYGKLQFVDVSSIKNKHSLLYMQNSFLGNTHFSNVDFKSFSSVDIENSDLTSISTSCVTWFTEKNVESKDKRNAPRSFFKTRRIKNKHLFFDLKTLKGRRELYRQLKLSLEKQGDKIQSLIFKKYETKAYYKYLRLSKGNFTDRFILFVGQTNDHGLNWWKPVLILLPFILIFYLLIIISASTQLSFHHFNLDSWDLTWNELNSNFSIFPELFNPTHSIDKLLPVIGYQRNFGVNFWDFISKLFLAFFIFQTITAFRKFSK